jgi:nitroreductase
MDTFEAIRSRYSCRIFMKRPIEPETRQSLKRYMQAVNIGPLGTHLRFELLAAGQNAAAELRGLGTYGFIRNPAGFIVGAAQAAPRPLEDYGYCMEQIILEATRLGLNTCWLGGTFTQSSFAVRVHKMPEEVIPAVTAAGYAAPDSRARDFIRRRARADRRLPWEKLFFSETFDHPLTREQAGDLALALEMVRLAPSASNKQHWRILKQGRLWHFYLERTPNYGQGSLLFTILRLADLQRLDIGIAMCHLELSARELGHRGEWIEADPGLPLPNERMQYIITWQQKT